MNTLLNLQVNTLDLAVFENKDGTVTIDLFIDRSDAFEVYTTFESLESFQELAGAWLDRYISTDKAYGKLIAKAIQSI